LTICRVAFHFTPRFCLAFRYCLFRFIITCSVWTRLLWTNLSFCPILFLFLFRDFISTLLTMFPARGRWVRDQGCRRPRCSLLGYDLALVQELDLEQVQGSSLIAVYPAPIPLLTAFQQVIAAYGERWFRIWAFFLAYSTIVSRQGSASVFQITAHKNLNAFHRMEGLGSHTSLRLSDRARNNQ
jgi:hypothetical protein